MSAVPADFDFKKLSGEDKSYLDDIKFPQEMAMSPVEKPRKCTDMLCCLIFGLAFIGMFVASFYGYMAGEPWKLIAPIDGDGRICGYYNENGIDMTDYRHLYIGDVHNALSPTGIATLSVFDYGVCVKQCPTEKTEAVECIVTAEVTDCNGVPKAEDAYTSYELLSYCMPNYDSLPETLQAQYDAMTNSVAGTSMGGLFAEVMTAKSVIGVSVIVCLIVTMLYIFLMHYCAFWLAWISVGLIQLALVAIGYFAFSYRKDQIAEGLITGEDYTENSMATTLSWITWLSWIFAGIYYIVIICSFQSLRIAVAVIQTAASFVADSKRLILIPVLYFGIAIILSLFFIAGLVCVSSIGVITPGSATLQTKDIEWEKSTEYLFYYMCFMYLWVMAFCMAMNEFVVIVAGITWYYSDKEVEDADGIPGDSDVTTGMWWALRYHMGTLAAGSLIQAIVWAIRIIFEYLAKKMEGSTGANSCTQCLVKCIRCCLACFDRFIRYINRNAYIYCALTGESYCSSAINSFMLILKNAAKFGFVEGIAGCFMFIAKFFIAIMTTLVSYFLLGAMVKVSDPYAPLFVIFMLSYMIATIFIEIFDTGANTILQCYLLDCEVGLCDDEHIPKSLKKFFSDKEIEDAMKKTKVDEGKEPLVSKDGGKKANDME